MLLRILTAALGRSEGQQEGRYLLRSLRTSWSGAPDDDETPPLMSFPKPMEEVTGWLLLLLFSFRTSSSLDMSSRLSFFLLFFFLCRGGSFLGKVNMGKMTSSMAKAHSRKPLHLQEERRRWEEPVRNFLPPPPHGPPSCPPLPGTLG